MALSRDLVDLLPDGIRTLFDKPWKDEGPVRTLPDGSEWDWNSVEEEEAFWATWRHLVGQYSLLIVAVLVFVFVLLYIRH